MATAAAMIAGVGPGLAAKVFDYNRENFQEDREQRMKKEFHERGYRMVQAQLWRQDVRDFVSLTEMKMSLYLIVNVLLLGFTMTLWCEGQLPETTPDWLVMGYQIAAVVSFSFLLLTIWLAMHAGVAAQSYQTRVLTQLVRLPIPTWQELEAARTSGSEFEKLESRQMFRIPFVTGKQENFIPGRTAASEESQGLDPSSPLSGSGGWDAYDKDTEDTKGMAADPWGLERRGDDLVELGYKGGQDVAGLRHMRLIRQAAVYWQTYDAFARVSMSVGINQLMLGMSYYILGYALLEDHCPIAAFGGVACLMGSSEVIARVDLTLPVNTQRALQFLLGVGPILSSIAAYFWAEHRDTAAHYSEILAPIAYISNGLVIGLMTIFVQVEEQENGSYLPRAFRGVLFLDVFGWVRNKDIDKGEDADAQSVTGDQVSTQGRSGFYSDAYTSELSRRRAARPQASAVKYDKQGRSLPWRPADLSLPEDMRYTPGAPRSWEKVNSVEPPAKEFWDPVTFMPPDSRERRKLFGENEEDAGKIGKPAGPFFSEFKDGMDSPIETGHDNEMPGLVPWRVFRNAAFVTCVVWIAAGVGCVLRASVPRLAELGFAYEDPVHHEGSHSPQHTAALLAQYAGTLSRKNFKTPTAELLETKWPYSGIVPSGLSCDAAGRHLLVTDGLSTFAADIHQTKIEKKPQADLSLRQIGSESTKLSAHFQQVPSCPALLGESLQDTALACAGPMRSSCEAYVLHRQGKRLAKCDLTDQPGAELFDLTTAWMEKTARTSKSHTEEQAMHLLVDPTCGTKGGSNSPLRKGCTTVGTNHGRAARLQLGIRGDDLVPMDVMDEKDEQFSEASGSVSPTAMRSFTERYIGVLQKANARIDVLDMDGGGSLVASLPLGIKQAVESFCAGSDYVYLLGSGPHPSMWRIPIPEGLKDAKTDA
eukprot:TRINITY_DN109256_c0_g1_i1.p1 TRINITY_DN109256_c0_g1~~TRINITY_DN109256_c0_g1_i1.p1  ORF type:complete len:931 (-),score=183.44 TRINITY_DN109256_c0_g1_i1:139-2931(-)